MTRRDARPNKRHKSWRKHEQPLRNALLLLAATLVASVQCQSSSQIHFEPASSKQYYAQPASASFLVTSQQQPNNNNNDNSNSNHIRPAQKLQHAPRQAAQQLDNVIESTPPSLTASLISIKTTPTSNHNHHQHHSHSHNHYHQPASLVAQQPQSQPQPQPQPQPLSGPSCQLPLTWTGKWYQSNKEPIRVTNTEISDKGVCRDQKGDKYLFEYSGAHHKHSNQINQPCLMCLVINERHLNVLQYKESSCQTPPPNYFNRSGSNLQIDDDHSLLESICSDITGDAQLESLFRLDTPSIECPVSGQYSFSYDNCREPQSSLDSCIDKKQLNFKFSACPDVPGSESKFEVLKCYADWTEGNNYYMIGRLEHASNHLDKGKFRCFVYEKTPDGKSIQMAQSLEESCYGLISAYEGPKTLRLTVRPPAVQRCSFPSYIQSQSENWLSVDNSLIYMFNQNSTKYHVKETREGSVIEEATCLQQFSNNQIQPSLHPHLAQQQNVRNYNNQAQQAIYRRHSSSASSYIQADQSSQTVSPRTNDMVYLVQITKNCHTTNYCVRFYKRSNGIVQIDYFIHTPGDNQCRNAFTSAPQTQIITSTNLEHQRCPFDGAYTIEAPIESDLTYNPSNIFVCPRQSFLTSQCDHPSRLKIHSKCSPGKFMVKNLQCLGSWTTNGLVRLLLTDDDRQRYSAWYRDYSGLAGLSSDSSAQDNPQPSSDQASPITRSQHLLTAASANANTNANANANAHGQQMVNSIAPVVDLQIALITPQPIPTKPMLVRLTRRNHCSDLKGYFAGQGQGQGWFASQMPAISASLPTYYASSSTSSFSSSSSSSIASAATTIYLDLTLPLLIVNLLVTMFLNRGISTIVHR